MIWRARGAGATIPPREKEPLTLIAIPSDTTDGLDSAVSEHFGHCAAFTLVTMTDDTIGEVSVLENEGHEEGGCMAPVNLLKGQGVEVLLAGGMGGRPLAGFQQVGIDVRSREGAGTVREAVELYVAGGCPSFGEAQTCGGGEGGCGGHGHHHEPETFPIEGKADIRDGRLVTVDFEIKDRGGAVLGSSTSTGPMRFVYGASQIFPAIEQALAGVEPGFARSALPLHRSRRGREDRPARWQPPPRRNGCGLRADREVGRGHQDERVALGLASVGPQQAKARGFVVGGGTS